MTFARKHKKGTVDVKNSYYKTPIKDTQGGIDANGMSDKKLLEKLGGGWNILDDMLLPFTFYTLTGNGDSESSPYLIASATDWNHIASNIEKGKTYSGKFFKLTADISVSRMLGVGHKFMGNFDGDGHTLEFNYEPLGEDNACIAPFKSAEDATFKNLHVTGEIVIVNFIAGGLIGNAVGNITITNCRSSITIDCIYEGDGTGLNGLESIARGRQYGGFIGFITGEKTVFTGCTFDGVLKGKVGSSTGNSAGFVGSIFPDRYAEFNDCMSDGLIAMPHLETCSIFIRDSSAKLSKFNNCYWTSYMVDDLTQGKEIHTVKSGDGITIEHSGTPTVYDVSRITAYGTGMKYNDGVHGDRLVVGEGETVSLNLKYNKEPEAGYAVTFTADHEGVISGNSNPYTLTMPGSSVTIRAAIVKTNTLTLADGNDNTDAIQEFDGQTVDVVYDRVLSAIENEDGTWTPRCYSVCLPYDFNLYENVESGQVNLYRLKYVDTENSQFIFTNDFGFASGGMGWLLVVNHGAISLNATKVMISAQTKSEEVYDYQSKLDQPEADPQVIGSWTGTFGRIYDDEAEPQNIYSMQSDGTWARSRVTDKGAKGNWVESFRAFFQPTEPLGTDTFKAAFTFTGAADQEETGEIETFPAGSFEGDLFEGDEATGIIPVIRTIEADGSSRYFDLQGRQLSEKPVKGIYIKDGKKYMKK